MTDQLLPSFPSRTIGSYLRALASGTPTPGGGSAAGLSGALGCSLGAMVCHLTRAKEEDDALASLAERFEEMASDLLALAERDEQVYGSYRTAMAMPRTSDQERSARREAIEQALTAAADVPIEASDTGIAAIDCLSEAAEIGTRHALGDLLTGGYLLQAMILGSLENVRANAALMTIPENQERFGQAAEAARYDLDASMATLHRAVAARQG